jgi:hypothetical protein
LWATSLALKQKFPHRRTVIDRWMINQADYFIGSDRRSGRSKQDTDADERNKWWAKRLFLAGLFVAGLILMADRLDGFSRLAHWVHCWEDPLDVAAVTFLAVAAALAVSRNLWAYEVHGHNYKQMGTLFDRSLTVASGIPVHGEPGYKPEHDGEFKEVVRELGREALSENAEWLLDHRDRAVEPGP